MRLLVAVLAVTACAAPTMPSGPSVLYVNACLPTTTFRLFLNGVDESEWVLAPRQYRAIQVGAGSHVVGYMTLALARTDTVVVSGPTVYPMGCV